jgi:hypothetical protein
MDDHTVTPIRAGINVPAPPPRRKKRAPRRARVHRQVAKIVQDELTRLWQVHGIIELVIHSIGDEMADDPPRKYPLRAAAALLARSLEVLDPISTPGELEVAHG